MVTYRIQLACFLSFVLLFTRCSMAQFAPDVTDYDAYGVKLAMNDYFLTLARNGDLSPSFLIKLAPYNQILDSSKCSTNYPSSSMFIYTVALGKKQTQNQTYFFFAGEYTGNQSGPFVGIATVNTSSIFNSTSNTSSSASCNSGSFTYSVGNLSTYDHQEYYILDVDPLGSRAYGFSNLFLFVFDGRNTATVDSWNGNATWPDSTFMPHAVDIADNFAVIAGFVRSPANATTRFHPLIYLINFNASDKHPYVVGQYKPIPTNGTWQDLLTNDDANLYSAKYDLSVSIDDQGNVLVGMQFINRVFLFYVSPTNPRTLTLVSRNTNGRSVGNGKSIAWLNDGIAAIMVNTYSLTYQWSASQVFLFDTKQDVYNSTAIPLSVFPNSHQLLPKVMSPTFLNIASSPSGSLALLDNLGRLLIFTPTSPGYYPYVQDIDSMPVITTPRWCMAGAFKSKAGVHDCVLCPPGTRNSNESNLQCIACSSSSYCPLGSVSNVPKSLLQTTSQVVAYPHSPESTIFDEILIHNMFSINGGRCLVISPLFWALIVAGVVIVIVVVMEFIKLCVKHPAGEKTTETLKYAFKHTDLIGEGEFWVGGLASFSIIVLVCFSYSFSASYLKQYPIENSTDSYFACDLTMRNAKFETNVQSLAIPPVHGEQEMFDLLNGQSFTLDVYLINTQITCAAISLQALLGTAWTTIRWNTCDNVDSVIILHIDLPFQQVSVEIDIADERTIGALQLGLSGHGHVDGHYILEDLHFYRTFYKDGQILARNLPIPLAITKVINETRPMSGEESDFEGIIIPTFTVDTSSLFLTKDQYTRSALTMTTLTVTISETPFYVKNLQEPIARVSEVVFRNLLFTVVCLEIFGLVFVLYKLAFKPIYTRLVRRKAERKAKHLFQKQESNGDLPNGKHFSSIETAMKPIETTPL